MKKNLLYLFAILNIAIVIFFWWNGSHFYIFSGKISNEEIAFGRLLGLFAELIILTQLILIGRITWIEREFGHDKMNAVHRFLGYSISILLVFHPLLLILGYSSENNVGIISQFFNFFTSWEDVWKAVIAWIIFAIIIILALPQIRKKLKYEYWYFSHLSVYLAIALAFGHQINTADVSFGTALYYWLIFNFAIGGVYLLYRFLRPWYRFLKFQFKVDRIVQETHDVYSVYITGRNLEKFTFEAGQFANYTFLTKGMWYTHPFSFSSTPSSIKSGKYIRISVKAVGDFTSKIKDLKPGTKVVIDGPLGIFTENSAEKNQRSQKGNKFLLIAGGIGITPIRSLLESLCEEGKARDVVLLYGNKSEKDIVFKDELEKFEHKYHYVLSGTSDPKFELGFIDQEKIIRLAPDFIDREIYICGPVVMMNKVIEIFEKLGVPSKHIHFERFGY